MHEGVYMRTVEWIIGTAVLGLVLSGCGQSGTPGDPGAEESKPSYEVEEDVDISGSPTWKGADDDGSITIGVYHDQPGIGNLTAGGRASTSKSRRSWPDSSASGPRTSTG